MAVYLATLTFNEGMHSLTPLFERLGGEGIGPYCQKYLVAKDATHLKKAEAKASEEAKKRRKLRCVAKKASKEQLKAAEGGTFYGSGIL